jgi:hypothetical protein
MSLKLNAMKKRFSLFPLNPEDLLKKTDNEVNDMVAEIGKEPIQYQEWQNTRMAYKQREIKRVSLNTVTMDTGEFTDKFRSDLKEFDQDVKIMLAQFRAIRLRLSSRS